MRKIMVLGKSIPLIAVLITSLLTSSVLGAYVGHFLITRPATVSVVTNSYEVGTYADELLTTTATSLDFPDAVHGDLSGSTVTAICYIALIHPEDLVGIDLRAKWRSPNLPVGMTLTAKWLNGAEWQIWAEDAYGLSLSVNYLQRQIRFELDTGNADPGDYSFTVEIETGQWS